MKMKVNYNNVIGRVGCIELPIDSYEDKISSLLEVFSVLIIRGPTGCGKTTRVPQFIYNYCTKNKKYCNIAITQPRRIAAIGVANRVSEEMNTPLGKIVGYQIGLDKTTANNTAITYMTVGILLRKLIDKKNMSQFSHIIIDEVHERSQEIDFLLLLAKQYLSTVSLNVKIILMSATMNVDNFSAYFSLHFNGNFVGGPALKIDNSVMHRIYKYYLCQIEQILGSAKFVFNKENPIINDSLFDVVATLLTVFNEWDLEKGRGAVLIFLPGIGEIELLYQELKRRKEATEWYIIPLHSSIPIKEQRRVMSEPPSGQRKIILSTNMAESSLTLPDVDYIIDFCLQKIKECSPDSNYSQLQLRWASQMSCEQRAGRVGRVRSGRVYRLVPLDFYQTLDKENVPEMLRSPLPQLVLMSKILDLGYQPRFVLSLAISPPALDKIEHAITQLKELGGLRGNDTVHDGELTFLGHVMASLPISPVFSKLIVLGCCFGLLRDCVIIAAGMSLRNVFSTPFKKQFETYKARLTWSGELFSDPLSYLNVYHVWERNIETNAFINCNERKWMESCSLQPRAMFEWRQLVSELADRLPILGVCEPSETRLYHMTKADRLLLTRIAICGAFYPNYFKHELVDEDFVKHTLEERDPHTHVYFNKRPINHPLETYSRCLREKILKKIALPDTVRLSVHDVDTRIYVEFEHGVIRNNDNVVDEIYRAVKYRKLGLKTEIFTLPLTEAKYRAGEWRKGRYRYAPPLEPFPNKFKLEKVRVSYVADAGRIFIQDITAVRKLKELESEVNLITKEVNLKNINEKHLLSAPYHSGGRKSRVIVLKLSVDKTKVLVKFIDYGEIRTVLTSQLSLISKSIMNEPPLALECVLVQIQPPKGALDWNPKTTKLVSDLITGRKLNAHFYSEGRTDGVFSLRLGLPNPDGDDSNPLLVGVGTTVNDMLLQRGLADLTPECQKQLEMQQEEDIDMPIPYPDECDMKHELLGPYSPLETTVQGLVRCHRAKEINIGSTSANSVILHADPQIEYDRMIVAAEIVESSNKLSLTLHETTVMPAIHGFLHFMALMFCPRVCVVSGSNGSHPDTLICGLGCKSNGESLFPDHDLILDLDFVLTQDMISTINKIRLRFNKAVAAMQDDDAELLKKCQAELYNIICPFFSNIAVTKLPKNPASSLDLWTPYEILPYEKENLIWPRIHNLFEFSLILDPKYELHKKHEQMVDVAQEIVPFEEMKCLICSVPLRTIDILRVHLSSESHYKSMMNSK